MRCECDALATKPRVCSRQPDRPGLLGDADPDGASASDKREGVVADECGGAFKVEKDRVIGVSPYGSELVRDAEDDAGGIGSVGEERGVVRHEQELAIGPAARQ